MTHTYTYPEYLVIFDLDGTLANADHRQHLIERSPKDWGAYFAECPKDTPNWPAIRIFWALDAARQRNYQPYYDMQIWTGRSEAYRMETFGWLVSYNLRPSRLLMRNVGDHRPSEVVKAEWLDALPSPPFMVFDDREKDTAWWRSRGITCLQIADHKF